MIFKTLYIGQKGSCIGRYKTKLVEWMRLQERDRESFNAYLRLDNQAIRSEPEER